MSHTAEPDPLRHRTFVHADGKLAEFMCQVHLIDLTPERAQELRSIHGRHPPDECVVHLEAAYLLLLEDDV
ncbi:hypothetical protein [Nocardia blacklockiae]|uniref:hypothetical protein n=1 Tax=Nocardia blacklockiae TaxID=480036 RepID=UPI00189526AF|nr:hypothetical protein [Nocardia blacklockiae]MBF6175570.1 hypothetical protein [Nocardia blacklockiae]